MATDRDDDVSRGYRGLGREEPPAALDTAILAASRRAVRVRPGGVRRWGPPLSIAAMLVLASGIVLRMQAEQPGIETSAPESRPAVPSPATQAQPGVSQPERPASEPAAAAPEPPAPAASTFVPEAKRIDAPAAKPRAAKRLEKTAPAAPESFAPAPPPQSTLAAPQETPSEQRIPAPAAMAASPPPAAAAPPPAAAPAPAADTASTARSLNFSASPQAARREAAGEQRAKSTADAGAMAKDVQKAETAEAALERIARLRAEGRDAEADRALESFIREHPEYRIPDAVWERVRARPR
jgi:hypothetical protein